MPSESNGKDNGRALDSFRGWRRQWRRKWGNTSLERVKESLHLFEILPLSLSLSLSLFVSRAFLYLDVVLSLMMMAAMLMTVMMIPSFVTEDFHLPHCVICGWTMGYSKKATSDIGARSRPLWKRSWRLLEEGTELEEGMRIVLIVFLFRLFHFQCSLDNIETDISSRRNELPWMLWIYHWVVSGVKHGDNGDVAALIVSGHISREGGMMIMTGLIWFLFLKSSVSGRVWPRLARRCWWLNDGNRPTLCLFFFSSVIWSRSNCFWLDWFIYQFISF